MFTTEYGEYTELSATKERKGRKKTELRKMRRGSGFQAKRLKGKNIQTLCGTRQVLECASPLALCLVALNVHSTVPKLHSSGLSIETRTYDFHFLFSESPWERHPNRTDPRYAAPTELNNGFKMAGCYRRVGANAPGLLPNDQRSHAWPTL
jgi:hypothetical protein